MKSKLKKLEGTSKQLDIEMPKEIVERKINEVLEEIRKNTEIPGFRKGKAPLDMVVKNSQMEAMEEAQRRLIPQGYQQALEEHAVAPVSYPEVSDVEMSVAGVLKFKAKVDTHPEVGLKKYKGLKVVATKVGIDDNEISETFERFRNINAEFKDVDRPIQKGDFAICDVETVMDGKVISKKRENMWVEADKEASMLGMGEDLCGAKKGDSKEVEVTLPEGYPDKKYAGKKATFKIDIKETKEKILPEIDDELAKKIGKDSIAEAREEIKSQLLEKKEANVKVEMQNQILDQLLKAHTFSLPESMVKRQLEVLIQKAENDLLHKGVEKEAIESHKEKLSEQLGKEAENKVRAYFILDEIGNREDVKVSDEDVDQWLSALAASYSQPVESVKKYYEEHDLINGLREQLREEKTLEYLLSEASVNEKSKK
ncbi:MAG: trigger factor [Candidatus Tantalella remota]|nr:trigger factor [Candidatus Tantalella remota]